jgi:aldose 1-epimerase
MTPTSPRETSPPETGDPGGLGGTTIVTLERPAPDPDRPGFVSAQILPGRGMMTWQVRAHLPGRGLVDLLVTPPWEEAQRLFSAAGEAFPGNPSYLLGGAILLPYANRIRGTLSADGRTIETRILGRKVRLPANAGGPGGERCAMHGLLLATQVSDIRRETTGAEDRLLGFYPAGDFGWGWPSSTEVTFDNVLRGDAFTLTLTARNSGRERLPMGIGWHPYFALPSGLRRQARLHLPARRRAVVDDQVLPTGEIVPVHGTPYDFSPPGGRAFGGLSLDDCFLDLQRTPEGEAIAELVDPAASFGLRIVAASPSIRAFQVYSPPEASFAAVEPQLNLADPFGAVWGPDVDTGMAILEPGEAVVWSARLELFTPRPAP